MTNYNLQIPKATYLQRLFAEFSAVNLKRLIGTNAMGSLIAQLPDDKSIKNFIESEYKTDDAETYMLDYLSKKGISLEFN